MIWLCGLLPGQADAQESGRNEVALLLQSRDFWDTAGRQGGRQWTRAEERQLADLQFSSQNPVTRLRANKVLVDLASNGRVKDKTDEAAVIACFQYLEEQLATRPVKTLCADQGFTHYFGPLRSGGTFLIEHVGTRRFNGGLNLHWDAGKQTVAGMKAWGEVPVD